jgi:hypothetical protein
MQLGNQSPKTASGANFCDFLENPQWEHAGNRHACAKRVPTRMAKVFPHRNNLRTQPISRIYSIANICPPYPHGSAAYLTPTARTFDPREPAAFVLLFHPLQRNRHLDRSNGQSHRPLRSGETAAFRLCTCCWILNLPQPPGCPIHRS